MQFIFFYELFLQLNAMIVTNYEYNNAYNLFICRSRNGSSQRVDHVKRERVEPCVLEYNCGYIKISA